jgi:hypothetical protein
VSLVPWSGNKNVPNKLCTFHNDSHHRECSLHGAIGGIVGAVLQREV